MSVDRNTFAGKMRRLTKYRTEWEKEHFWLSPVRGEESKANCMICNKIFTITSGLDNVRKHSASKFHILGVLKQRPHGGINHFIPHAYPVRKTKYQTEWEKKCSWVRPVMGDKFKANCTICDLVFDTSNGGLCSLRRHESTRGHKGKALLDPKLHSGFNYFIQHGDMSKRNQEKRFSDPLREEADPRRSRMDTASTSHSDLSLNYIRVENTSPPAKRALEIHIDLDDDDDDNKPAVTLWKPIIEVSTQNSVFTSVNTKSHQKSPKSHSNLSSNTIELENSSRSARKADEIHNDYDDSDEELIKPLLQPIIESSAQNSVTTSEKLPSSRPPAVVHNSVFVPQKQKHSLVVPNHQQSVMSNVSSLWKTGRLCDAIISNGIVNVKVHKMILGAVCPKVLHVFCNTPPHKLPKVTFPSSVSKEALLAFAEYMYNGVLDLDPNLLNQMKVIAQRLDMKDFEQLCSNQLKTSLLQNMPPTVCEPMLREPCSSSGLIQHMIPEGNQTSVIEMIPIQSRIQQKDVHTVDFFKSISTTGKTNNVSLSNLPLVEVGAETDDNLMEVVNNNLAFSAANENNWDIGLTNRPPVKIEKIDPEDAQYGREASSLGIECSTSHSIFTSKFPHFTNTNLSQSSTTVSLSTSQHENNTLNKSSPVGHDWKQNDINKGSINAVSHPTDSYPINLFRTNWANESSRSLEIKEEYDAG